MFAAFFCFFNQELLLLTHFNCQIQGILNHSVQSFRCIQLLCFSLKCYSAFGKIFSSVPLLQIKDHGRNNFSCRIFLKSEVCSSRKVWFLHPSSEWERTFLTMFQVVGAVQVNCLLNCQVQWWLPRTSPIALNMKNLSCLWCQQIQHRGCNLVKIDDWQIIRMYHSLLSLLVWSKAVEIQQKEESTKGSLNLECCGTAFPFLYFYSTLMHSCHQNGTASLRTWHTSIPLVPPMECAWLNLPQLPDLLEAQARAGLWGGISAKALLVQI